MRMVASEVSEEDVAISSITPANATASLMIDELKRLAEQEALALSRHSALFAAKREAIYEQYEHTSPGFTRAHSG